MGIINKKKEIAVIEKGTIQDNTGKVFHVDFAGDDNDFVNISYADKDKKDNECIKDLFKQNEYEIHDICFINNYSYLLVGCNKGLLFVYKRIINNKSNLKFEKVTQFQPHYESIIQIIKLQSDHILTLCSDSSSKILEIEIDTNSLLYQNEHRCDLIDLLLNEAESNSNNSAIELESGNLIISQGYFINFFVKKDYTKTSNEILRSGSTLYGKEYDLTKKIFTNSDNIFFAQVDPKTIAASQVSNNTLQFYNLDNYSLMTSITSIQFSNMSNCMNLINKDTLGIGGNNGSIYLVDTNKKQLYSVIHFDNCDLISCIRFIENDYIIMGAQYWNTNYDIIIYKFNDNKFEEISRTQKVHTELINDIKLVTMNISNNQNSLTKNYNVLTLGLDYRVKLILGKNN